jgi:hypothetical protein
MSDPKKVYPHRNNKRDNVTGDLNLDGKGPDGGSRAFDDSRSDVLRDLIREIIKLELAEQTQNTVIQPVARGSAISGVPAPVRGSNVDPNSQTQPMKTQQGFISTAEKQAARRAQWDEIEDLRKHLEAIRAADRERLAKAPTTVGRKTARPVQMPVLPANMTKEFVDKITKLTSYLDSVKIDPQTKYNIDDQIYKVVASDKAEKEKLAAIRQLIGGHLGMFGKAKIYLGLNEQEAAQDDIYGQWLLPQGRKDVPKKAKDEPNTPAEDKLLNILNDYLNGPKVGAGALSRVAPKLLDLLAQGKYTSVLAPPSDAKFAYRVMTLKTKELEVLLGRKLSGKELDPELSQKGFRSKGGTYTPRGTNVSSWSVSPKAFSKMYDSGFEVPEKQWVVFLKAPVSGNDFLLNPNVWYDASIDGAYYKQEREIIGVGPIQLDSIVYVNNKYEYEDKDGYDTKEYPADRVPKLLKHYPKVEK